MARGELKKYSNPTDLPARRSDSGIPPIAYLMVFGIVSLVALAVVALAAAVVGMSIAVVVVVLRPYLKGVRK